MKKAFTIASVKRLPCPATGYVIVWDRKTPGLGVRLTAGGARSYVFERRLHGPHRPNNYRRSERLGASGRTDQGETLVHCH
jgi:hypothetical protein